MLMDYDSVDGILNQFLPENELKEVNRILYGNQRHPKYVFHNEHNNIFVYERIQSGIENIIQIFKFSQAFGFRKTTKLRCRKISFRRII